MQVPTSNPLNLTIQFLNLKCNCKLNWFFVLILVLNGTIVLSTKKLIRFCIQTQTIHAYERVTKEL